MGLSGWKITEKSELSRIMWEELTEFLLKAGQSDKNLKGGEFSRNWFSRILAQMDSTRIESKAPGLALIVTIIYP